MAHGVAVIDSIYEHPRRGQCLGLQFYIDTGVEQFPVFIVVALADGEDEPLTLTSTLSYQEYRQYFPL